METEEKALLQQLREGSENALRALFDRYYKYLLVTAFRFIPDDERCKDLVQEVFYELWKRRASLELHTSLKSYLSRSVVNKALNEIKSRKRFQWEEDDKYAEVDSGETDVHDKMEHAGLEAAIHAAIDALPEKCRIVFMLSRFENMSHKEIAEQLNISVKTIENQITKALRILREVVTQYGAMLILSPMALFFQFFYK